MNRIVRKADAPEGLAETDRKFKERIAGMSRKDAYRFYQENARAFPYNTEETKKEFAEMNYKRCSFCTQRIMNFATEMTVRLRRRRDFPGRRRNVRSIW